MPFASEVRNVLRPVVHGMRHRWNSALYGRCAVLLYHRVTNIPTDPQLLAVHPERFDQQLSILKRDFDVFTVDRFDDHLLRRKKFPRNAVLLTFDDGYADNHHEARPLLEKHRLQALFYIASGYIGSGREYWWDELERLLLNRTTPLELDVDLDGLRLNVPEHGTPSAASDRAAYDSAMLQLRRIPSCVRDTAMARLRSLLGPEQPRPTHLPMSTDELRAFAASPSVVIGAHTRLHPSLAQVSEGEQQAEIRGSKADLEEMLGHEVKYFSYPFGTGADFSMITERIARETGFLHTAANYPGLVHARSPAHRFPRFLVRDWDGAMLERELRRFFRG